MSALLDWLAAHESALSAIAALIAISAGVAVLTRLIWTRMPSHVMDKVKRPAFLSDWRNIGLISLGLVALMLMAILALGPDNSGEGSQENAAPGSDKPGAGGKPSVAVLPLNNISDDPEQTYLADGIAEDVITLLSSNPRFFVVARNSSFTYKGKAVDIRQVGEELGVRYVVEGSLRKVGERLRVNVQLIDTSNGLHVWAEKYDRAYTDLFALQDEITNGIATALGDQIFTAEIARAHSKPTDNLDAWGLVMRANQALSIWNSQTSKKAVALYRQALQRDPGYAVAKAELARTLCWRAVNQWGTDPEQDFAEGYRLGVEALQMAPSDPLVLNGSGSCYGASAAHADKGIRVLRKAVKIQPNFAMAQAMLGIAYTFNGEPAKGIAPGVEALRLAPRSPYIYLYASWQAAAFNELGRYSEAESMLRTAIESYDGWWWTWFHLAIALAGQGDSEAAQQALYIAKEKEALFSLAVARGSSSAVYKNKGRNVLPLLEPIWPEDLLTATKNKTD